MNLNILHPGKAVEAAFEKPSLFVALVLILLPSLASSAGRMLYAAPVDLSGALYGIVLAYVSFFVLALVIFFLAWLVNRQATKGRFAAFFCALSLIKVASLVIVLISFLTMPLYLSEGAMEVALQAGKSSSPEMAAMQLSDFVAANPEAVNLAVLVVLLAITFIISLWAVYLIFKSIKTLAQTGRLAAIALTVIALIIVGLLPI